MMTNQIQHFVRDEDGATLVEYGLVVGLISIAAIAALQAVGVEVTNLFTMISTTLAAA